jgi:phage baseplate assembly protein W|tara:strand:+ start:1387 stop:1878 length:492 start_codon:yes stop_codon:yes gene_type:complete
MALPTNTEIFGVIPSKASRVNAKSKSPFVKGISYPLGKLLHKRPLKNLGSVKEVDYFSQSSDLELIKGMVRQLLLTRKGERVMNPSFGLKLDQFVFEPLDITTFEIIKSDIINQIHGFIPFLEVTKVNAFASEQRGGNALFVRLGLRVKNISTLAPFEVEVKL